MPMRTALRPPRKTLACAVAIFAALLAPCSRSNHAVAQIPPQAPDESSAKVSSKADAIAGKPIFERYCAPCHGINGGGGRGPRLNRAHLTYAPTDAALRAVIADGIPPAMPDAWYLSDEEIANVAAHIRALGKTPGELVPGDPVR